MIRSRIFVLLALTLCLVAFFSACAESATSEVKEENENEREKENDEEDDELSKKYEEAATALGAAQTSANNVFKKAERNLHDARNVLRKVGLHKKDAEQAAKEAEEETKGNAEAETAAQQARIAVNELDKLCSNATKTAQAAVTAISQVVQNAASLKNEVSAYNIPDSDLLNKYHEIKNKFSEFEDRAAQLEDQNTAAVKLLAVPRVLELSMSTFAEKAKLAKYQVLIISSRIEIDTVLTKADIDIQSAAQKRDEVNKIINEIREIAKNAPQDLSMYCNSVLNNANMHLHSASEAVKDAQKVKDEMLMLKNSVNDALEKAKTTSDPREAYDEVRNAKRYANEVKEKAPLIATAVKYANSSVTNANSTKRSLKTTVSKSNGELSTEDNQATDNPKPLPQDATEALQNDLKVNPTMLNAEETETKTSENALHQASDKPTVDKKQQPKVPNLNILKDKLQKGTKNGTTIPLVDGNPSALSVLGDSSVTLSVPLLAALIASAVLH